MNKSKISLFILSLVFAVCFVSCERYPIQALVGVPNKFESWPNPWYIYDDQINTKGSLVPQEWADNPYCDTWRDSDGRKRVILDFEYKSGVHSGKNCIKFYWRGNEDNTSKTFFGFGLMAREEPGGKIALGEAGYTSLKFYLKGKLEYGCAFEINVPGTNVSRSISAHEISSSWQEFEIPMNAVGNVEYTIAMSLKLDGSVVTDTTNGGTVFLDDIKFVKDY